MTGALPPGSTIGIIGGGQLGRMLAMAAARLGYRTIVLEPGDDCPAGQVCNLHIRADYDDVKALKELAEACDVVTYEFENVPVSAARKLEETVPVRPGPLALEIAQDRLDEKRFLNKAGLATADFRTIDSDDDLGAALAEFSGNGVLKTRRLGYDGKGQKLFRDAGADDHKGSFAELGNVPLILESLVPFEREISVIAARGLDGTICCYDPAENIHRDGILRTSTVPAAIDLETAAKAAEMANGLLAALEYVGVLGLELFVLPDGSLVANEFAPRVHNSGHWTEAACTISQFEQQIRAVAGIRPGQPVRHSDCIMENLIGSDVDNVPQWLATPDTMVHLYGKSETRNGRKMGHVTTLTGPAHRS